MKMKNEKVFGKEKEKEKKKKTLENCAKKSD